MRGDGFAFRAPAAWPVRRHVRTTQAQSGGQLVSVTVFPLAKPFRPAFWARATRELDQVAAQLAQREQATLTRSADDTIAGLRARVYELDHAGKAEKIGFVLNDRREYQLFCHDAGSACGTLFSSFRLSAPAA